MAFDSLALFDAYLAHPDHVIEQYWLKQVKVFLEIDYDALGQ